ncbi:MAG TPA: DUF192 domain-containing protein [Verrucomicrobiae bacterium]|jgi:uncharacterized membrane protein (UPF0127 family)
MRSNFLQLSRVNIFPLTLAVLIAVAAGCKDAQRGTVSGSQTSAPAVPEKFPPYLTRAQPRLQTMKMFVGPHELATELALKPTEIYTGMMWRTNMAESEGMLFVFADATSRSFYMKNTYVPLSIAYIDREGVIQEIHDLQPRNEEPVPSTADNIQFCLEVPQGWFKRHSVVPGAVVRTPYGELKNTFSFRPLK